MSPPRASGPTSPWETVKVSTATQAPGGSSSGSAVAVASGLVPLAVGTDTSGSTRVPAAYTGCVGFRATRFRYGPHDFLPLSATLDSVGLLGRNVEDVRLLDSLLSGEQRNESPRIRGVIPTGEWTDACQMEVRIAFEESIERLRRCGIRIEHRPISSMTIAQRVFDRYGTIVGAEAWANHVDSLNSTNIEAATRRRLNRNAATEARIGPVRQAMPQLRRLFAADLSPARYGCTSSVHRRAAATGTPHACPHPRLEPGPLDPRQRTHSISGDQRTAGVHVSSRAGVSKLR